jgi:8-oxo-dGTP pyrophosphatase MutT (NUDIX family)/predicted ATPase
MGPHGAGKTTLCRAVENRIRTVLHELPVVVPDVARHRLQGAASGEGRIAQDDIIETQLRIEGLFAQASDVVVFDNTSAGHLAYHRYWNGIENEALRERVAASMAGYSAVLWLPPNPAHLVDDGLRPTDPAFQAEITERQRTILAELNVTFEVVEDWSAWTDAEWDVGLRRWTATRPEREERRKQYVTAVGVVRRGDDVLFVKRHDERIRAADARWDLPGGRVEFGEAPALTVEREIFEETGYLVQCERPLRAVQSNRWQLGDLREEHVLVLGFEASIMVEHAFDVSTDHGVADIRWASLSSMAEENLLPGIATFVAESFAP